MKILKKIFDLYINSSIHVAFSVYALIQMTSYLFQINKIQSVSLFAFFGTIVGYNFVKYDALVRVKKKPIGIQLKSIALLSLVSLVLVGYYFFQLERITQIVSFGIFAITALYTLPFFPNRKNARNWAGVKIYMVAICWVGVTLVLPIINAEIPFTTDFFIKCMQRFILVFVLILVFEILDLANDDPHLQTVPQMIGVKRTKNLGYVLLMIFCGLEIFNSHFNFNHSFQVFPLLFEIAIAIVIALFLTFANEKRSKYYTSFWVEAVPVFWWLMVILI